MAAKHFPLHHMILTVYSGNAFVSLSHEPAAIINGFNGIISVY